MTLVRSWVDLCSFLGSRERATKVDLLQCLFNARFSTSPFFPSRKEKTSTQLFLHWDRPVAPIEKGLNASIEGQWSVLYGKWRALRERRRLFRRPTLTDRAKNTTTGKTAPEVAACLSPAVKVAKFEPRSCYVLFSIKAVFWQEKCT